MTKENNSNHTLEVLKKGIEFNEQGDLDKAASLYQEAIDRVLANKDIKMLIAAKQRLAEIKESQKNIEEANKLYEDIDIIVERLELVSILEFDSSCENRCCNGTPKNGYECKGSGSLKRTVRCKLSFSNLE